MAETDVKGLIERINARLRTFNNSEVAVLLAESAEALAALSGTREAEPVALWRVGEWGDGSTSPYHANIFCDAWETAIVIGIPKEQANEIVEAHNAALASPPPSTIPEGSVLVPRDMATAPKAAMKALRDERDRLEQALADVSRQLGDAEAELARVRAIDDGPVPTHECEFRVGQAVCLAKPYAEEDPRRVYRVVGITWEHRSVAYRGWNITVATEADISMGYGATDGFSPSDLRPTTSKEDGGVE